jgi:tRNA 5-methylaminomethyl-2-thiouridine biosynthesis bifunctional protein
MARGARRQEHMNEPRTEGCAEGDDRGSSPNAGHDPGDASPDAIAIAALLRASDLPARWRNRSAFTLLSIGAASLALLEAIEAAWGADPEHCERLDAIVVDAPWPLHPPGGEWPPATPGLHRIERAGGRIQWLFAHGDGERALRELVANVDAFILVDGSCSADLAGSAAATQPSRSFDRLEIRSAVDRALRPGLFVRQPDAVKALARLAAPGASLVVNCADAALIARLRSAGFAARNARERPDAAGDVAESRARPREGTVTAFHADLNPTRAVRRPPGRPARAVHRERRVVIVGAGLAGCAAAWAFAQHGWTSTLLERQSSVAAGASGNPAGLFHGIVNGVDGLHARFNRAAALEARAAVAVAVRDHAAAGAHDGLLQCVETGSDLDAMRALLVRLRLPAEWVVAVDAREASDAAGIPLTRPAWFHAQGGWVEPVELCRSYLERAGAAVALRFGQAVASLRREGDAWTLLDAEGLRLESAPIVVLANAGAAFELIGATGWPVEAVRGQLSVWRHAAAEGVLAPRLPIAGAGYVVPAHDGGLVFGATAFVPATIA